MSASGGGAARPPIDWAEVHRRLEAAAAASRAAHRLSPERARAVLDERARAISQPVATGPGDAGLELVIFKVGGESYGLESRYIFELFAMTDMAPLPGVGAPQVGLTAWRGDLLVILELETGAKPTPSHGELVLVVGDDRPVFGVLAGEVRGLRRVPRADIFAVQGTDAGRQKPLIGVTADAVLVLDAPGLIHLHT